MHTMTRSFCLLAGELAALNTPDPSCYFAESNAVCVLILLVHVVTTLVECVLPLPCARSDKLLQTVYNKVSRPASVLVLGLHSPSDGIVGATFRPTVWCQNLCD